MQTLKHGDRVKVIDGPRHVLGKLGSVMTKGPLTEEPDVCVRLDNGRPLALRRSQVLKIGDDQRVG